MKAYIKEIFESLQGESIFSGFPFVFVRFSGCSVKCAWCDTDYDVENKENNSWSLEELLEKTLKFERRRILITGGEALEQEISIVFMEKLIESGKEVHIETSGTAELSNIPYEVHIIMDIKPPSSKAKLPFLEKNLEYLKRNDEIKIVINDSTDLDFAFAKDKEFDLANRVLLSFSPTQSFLKKNNLQNLIMDSHRDIRINMQLHKFFWKDPEFSSQI